MTGQPNKENTDNNDDDVDNDDDKVTYTASQLRMARRKARRLGLSPTNGKQAIRMLKTRGIAIDDKEPNLTDSAEPEKPAAAQAETANALMQDKTAGNLPAAQVLGMGGNQLAVVTKEQRQLEIAKLEKKIKKRRETRMRRLIRRFSLFVLLPTLAMGIYYFVIATPLFVADTVMTMENASSAATGGLGDLMKNSPFSAGGEFTAVQDYLQSRAAFDRLQGDYPFVELFQGDEIDRFLRIDPDASKETQYGLYRSQVKISFDNTDHVLRMEVRTPDPTSAEEISDHLLSYAEERVDDKTQRVRDTAVADARDFLEQKAQDLAEAEEEIARISEVNDTLGAATEQQELQALIAQYRGQLTEYQVALQQLEQNANPNQSRVNGIKRQIEVLENTIDDLTNQGLEVGDSGTSVARLAQQMRIAETRLALATREYEQASINLQQAEAQARSQRQFITPILPPTATYEAVYPKKYMSTLSAFMVFFALYIIISITIEVIREQVSA